MLTRNFFAHLPSSLRAGLLIVLPFCLCSLPLLSQTSGSSIKAKKELPMPMTAPLFLEDANYRSVLYLVNQLNFGVEADVTLYDMNGNILTVAHRYLDANTSESISIGKVLSDSGMSASAGSLEVVSPENSEALLGQLSITREGNSKLYLDQELFMPSKGASRTLRAVIDSPENSPIVAVTNISPLVGQTLHMSCVGSDGIANLKSVNLRAKETKLVRACSTSGDLALSSGEVDGQFVVSPDAVTGMSGKRVAGISIESDGPAGEIAAFGFVEHSDSFEKYFSAMNFSDPGLLQSSGMVYAGVPVGASVSGASFSPEVGLTNFSSTTQRATVFLATSQGEFDDIHQVATVDLPAHMSRLVALAGLKGVPAWRNSFIVRSSGQPGDVLSKMMFKSLGSSLPNIELIGKDERDWHNGGDHPWMIDDSISSTLYLFNHGTARKELDLRIGAGTTVWLKQYWISPNETRAISINDIIKLGDKDDRGRVIPPRTRMGEIAWWAPSNGSPELSGRVVQTNSAGEYARNFSCGAYVGMCNLYPYEDTFYNDLDFEDNGNIAATPVYCTVPYGGGGGGGSCPSSTQTTTQTQSIFWEWSSGNASIARFNSSQDSNTSSTSSWTGMGVGSTRWTAKATSYGNVSSCTTGGPSNTAPTVTISGPTTITVGGNPASPYTLTAAGKPSGGTYTFSVSSGASDLNLSNTSTSTANTTQITGVAGGSAVVLVTYTVNEMSGTNTQNVTTLQANNLFVSNDTTGTVSCQYGTEKLRKILYTIRSGSITITDPIFLKEGVPNPTVDSCGVTIQTGATGFLSSDELPGNGYQFTDTIGDCPTQTKPSCSFSFPSQYWGQLTPSAKIATIGPVSASSTAVVVDGNSTSLNGNDFGP